MIWPCAHAKSRRVGPQVLLVLRRRVLRSAGVARERLGERIEMAEHEQPPVVGLDVDRAPVADARGAHADHGAVDRRVHRTADDTARLEVEPRVQMVAAVVAECAADLERLIEHRGRERREQRTALARTGGCAAGVAGGSPPARHAVSAHAASATARRRRRDAIVVGDSSSRLPPCPCARSVARRCRALSHDHDTRARMRSAAREADEVDADSTASPLRSMPSHTS
jgi:hypothetical protein